MLLRHFLIPALSFIAVFSTSSATYARLLHESARIVVYSTEAEPGNRNSHPVTLEPDQLSVALSRVKARSGDTGDGVCLFPVKNREESAKRLAKELGRIDPGLELHLVSFRHIGTFFSGQRNASAARVFVESGRLNLIFGQIDRFFSEFRDPDRPVPPMGSRRRPASLRKKIIPAEGITFVDGRNDWVAIDLGRTPPLQPKAVPAAKGSSPTPGKASLKATQPQAKRIEEKLQILKNLRDQDLITEQEYSEKKRQILDDL